MKIDAKRNIFCFAHFKLYQVMSIDFISRNDADVVGVGGELIDPKLPKTKKS